MSEGTRINKYLSELGICSRREADKWIEQGRVMVNRKKPATGYRVIRRDEVRVDGHIVSEPDEPDVYLALNKPPGIVSTTDPTEPNNIIQFVNYPKRIFPVGRLDKPSEGLIFLTSDGDIVNKILRAGNDHEKEYEVTVDKAITKDFIQNMAAGVPILGTRTKKCNVDQIDTKRFKITLIQGLNRQIRRMCEYFEYDVVKLKRTRIMNVEMDIPQGDWRELTELELKEIMRLTENSKKTERSKPRKPSKPKTKGPTKKKPSLKGGAKPKQRSLSKGKQSRNSKRKLKKPRR